jgi:hypothetical protein
MHSFSILKLYSVPSVQECHLLLSRLSPGAHVAAIAMQGTPYHRIAVNMEDAGFEIRDQIIWVAEIHVSIALARKPLAEKTVAQNILKYGTGGLNVDACRIGTTDKLGGGSRSGPTTCADGWGRPWRHDINKRDLYATHAESKIAQAETMGRFPANVILTKEAGGRVDEQSGHSAGHQRVAKRSAKKTTQVYGGFLSGQRSVLQGYSDSGGASRFFKWCDNETELIEYLTTLLQPV